jgi:VWFA-related protein
VTKVSVRVAAILYLTAVGFVSAAAIPAAQQAAQPPTQQTAPPPPTGQLPPAMATQTPLRTETRMVQLSVVVHDKSGAPVENLTKDDFVVTDEKQLQTVRVFEMETNQAPTTRPAALPANTYTNRLAAQSGVPNSVTVILLDGLNTNISDQNYARLGVVKFLAQLHPEDRVAIYTLGRDLRILQEFTNDSASLLKTIQNYKGRGSADLAASSPSAISGFNSQQSFGSGLTTINFLFNDEQQKEAAFYTTNRVHETVEAMKAIANHVSSLPGRKNLIWVSGSFPLAFGFDNTQRNIFAEKQSFDSDIADAVRALNAANLAIYPVDARGLLAPDMGATGFTSLDGQMNATENLSIADQSISFREMPIDSSLTMEALARGTGGRAFYNTNDIMGSIRAAIDDSKVTYTLGYYPEGAKWDGKYHNLKVEVKRPGLKVQYRKGYFALPDPKLTPKVRQAVIGEVAKSPLDATEIGVTAVAHPGSSDRTLKIGVGFDLRDVLMVQKDGAYTGAVDIVVLSLSDQNKILGALDQTFQLKLPPAVYVKMLSEGLSTTKELPVSVDAVQLRVVVRDANTGAMGTLRIPVADYFPIKTATH